VLCIHCTLHGAYLRQQNALQGIRDKRSYFERNSKTQFVCVGVSRFWVTLGIDKTMKWPSAGFSKYWFNCLFIDFVLSSFLPFIFLFLFLSLSVLLPSNSFASVSFSVFLSVSFFGCLYFLSFTLFSSFLSFLSLLYFLPFLYYFFFFPFIFLRIFFLLSSFLFLYVFFCLSLFLVFLPLSLSFYFLCFIFLFLFSFAIHYSSFRSLSL
jgi:hypothetical protein